MPRPLGPHVHGDPAHDTLRSAAQRLIQETDGAIDPRALELMLDDALAPEVMVGERVDTLMLASHDFSLEPQALSLPPTSEGRSGLLAFTERRLIAAHSYGIVRLRRFVEVFALGDDVHFRSTTSVVDDREVRVFDVANGQGWHRIIVPGSARVPAAVAARWVQYVTARLTSSIAPTWHDTTLTGWVDDDPTLPNQRLPQTAREPWWGS